MTDILYIISKTLLQNEEIIQNEPGKQLRNNFFYINSPLFRTLISDKSEKFMKSQHIPKIYCLIKFPLSNLAHIYKP